MDHPKFIVSNQKEEFIISQWVKYLETMEAQASLHIKVELSMTRAFIACQSYNIAKLETVVLRTHILCASISHKHVHCQ